MNNYSDNIKEILWVHQVIDVNQYLAKGFILLGIYPRDRDNTVAYLMAELKEES